jgi:CheY-like chemotaxis protein
MSPVLVVEDDESTREMLMTDLQLCGIPAVSAGNGREALDLMKRERPCVVLLDLMMPVMDGEAFRRRQLQDPDLSSVPVILLSARHDVPKRAEVLHTDGWIRKPFDIDKVVDVVRSYCTECRDEEQGGFAPY